MKVTLARYGLHLIVLLCGNQRVLTSCSSYIGRTNNLRKFKRVWTNTLVHSLLEANISFYVMTKST